MRTRTGISGGRNQLFGSNAVKFELCVYHTSEDSISWWDKRIQGLHMNGESELKL